jgi:hypothetical protein
MGKNRTLEVRTAVRTLLLDRLQRPLNIWSDHPSVDLLLATAVVGTHVWIVYHEHVGNVLHSDNQGQRLAVYGAGATMVTIIAGFIGTAIAQYGSSSGPIVNALRSTYGKAIRRNWLNITKWLLACTILCLVAMVIDGEKSPRGSEWVFESALAISIVKFVRLMFLFSTIMSAGDNEANLLSQNQNRPSATPVQHGTASR